MKKIKWKNLITTCIVTLIPMLIGIVFYNQLPEQIPVHFNVHNQPDSFASREFALFGIPGILTGIQIVLCLILDFTRKEGTEDMGIKNSIRWWVPVLSILVGILLVEYPLRVRLELRMYICIALCVISMMIGNYFTEMDTEAIKENSVLKVKDEEYAKLFSNILGYTFIIFGLIIVLTTRLHPFVSVGTVIALAVIVAIEMVCFRFKK